MRNPALLCLLSFLAASAQELKRGEIVSAYIVNFARNIEWREERRFTEFHFLAISDDPGLNRELRRVSASKTINGKPIRLTISESVAIPKDIHLVFISRGLGDLMKPVFRRIEGKNVLLITEGSDDKRTAMINLYGAEDGTMKFEINKANILNQGLKMRPDMVLLGGTEIDVAELYKESQDSLRIKEGRIEALGRHLDSLGFLIEAARREIEGQTPLIARQGREIREQKSRIEIQQIHLDEQRQRLDSQTIHLGRQRAALSRQDALLRGSRDVLERQRKEIEGGKAVLAGQQAEIDAQNASIRRQKEILAEQDLVIADQKSTQRLLILIIVLAFGLSYAVYRSYRLKKESNQRLQERKDELQRMLGQLEFARDKARQYLDIAGVIIVALDTGGRITMINQKGCEILGFAMADILGKDWFEAFVPEGARPDLVREFRRGFSGTAGPAGYSESPILARGGRERLIAWHNVPLRDEGGRIAGALVSGEDITEKKRAEREIEKLNGDLRERAAALEAANKELEAFSYSVSHDLRAPLRSIDGFSLAIAEDYGDGLDERGKDYLRRVRAAAQRMSQLIDDMLELSRVTRNEMAPREVDMSGMAEDIADRLRKMEPERMAEFAIEPGIVAIGDEPLLRIALENLFENAWKYTSKHPTARIEFGLRAIGGQRFCFIKDDGAGFDMKYAQKLFGAFQRMHTEAEFPGTGVGLATVQRIVRRHGGEIGAESEVEKGSTFFFSIPVKEPGNA